MNRECRKIKFKLKTIFLILFFSSLVCNPVFSADNCPEFYSNCNSRSHSDSDSNLKSKYGKFYWFKNFFDDVVCDYSIYYGKENLMWLGGSFLVAGLCANTNIDHSIHKFWQKSIRSKATDEFFKLPNFIGGFNYIRVYVAGIVLGSLGTTYDACIVYKWGYRALRTVIVLSPQATFLSWFLGAGFYTFFRGTAIFTIEYG